MHASRQRAERQRAKARGQLVCVQIHESAPWLQTRVNEIFFFNGLVERSPSLVSPGPNLQARKTWGPPPPPPRPIFSILVASLPDVCGAGLIHKGASKPKKKKKNDRLIILIRVRINCGCRSDVSIAPRLARYPFIKLTLHAAWSKLT